MTDAPHAEAELPSGPLSTMLHTILSSEDQETAVVIADAINLYLKAMKRRDGRTRFAPPDASGLLTIITILTQGIPSIESDIAQAFAGSPRRRVSE